MNWVQEIGIEIVLLFQGLGDWLKPFMLVLTYTGIELFYLFIAPAIYWCVNASLGLRIGLMMMITTGVNNILKLVFHGPRPYWIDERATAHLVETSFGAPSGHAQNSVVFWGVIAAWVKRTWFWIVAIALMFLVGISRIYLGVHFPHDVVIGWLVGIIILASYMYFEKPVTNWLKESGPTKQFLTTLAVSLLLIALGTLGKWLLADWTVPEIWIDNALKAAPGSEVINPVTISGVITAAGAFFGIGCGAILIDTRGGFDASGAFWKRLVRFFIGLIGIALFYFGLKIIFPGGDDAVGYLFRYIRYALVGLWAIGLAPMVFIKLKLAEPSKM